MSRDRLWIRRLHVGDEEYVHGHVFVCVTAYHADWLMRRLAPLLFWDDDAVASGEQRNTPVEPAQISRSARRNAQTNTTSNGFPTHSFQRLQADPANLVLNSVSLSGEGEAASPSPPRPPTGSAVPPDCSAVSPRQDVSITVTG